MNKTIGFIGAGKMAEAMIEGMLESNLIPKEKIMASARTNKTIEKINHTYGILPRQTIKKFPVLLIFLFLLSNLTSMKRLLQS